MLINATYVLSQDVHIDSSIDIELLYVELDSVYYYVHVIPSVELKDFVHFFL